MAIATVCDMTGSSFLARTVRVPTVTVGLADPAETVCTVLHIYVRAAFARVLTCIHIVHRSWRHAKIDLSMFTTHIRIQDLLYGNFAQNLQIHEGQEV